MGFLEMIFDIITLLLVFWAFGQIAESPCADAVMCPTTSRSRMHAGADNLKMRELVATRLVALSSSHAQTQPKDLLAMAI
jgi:hypothetical protein